MFEWRSVCGARPAVMGIINVTPDSFSDGGRFVSPASAIDHGLTLAEAGADLLDIGGESTRPGADPVSDAEERQRVVPVVAGLAATGVPVSIDTTKAGVAAAALDAGATVVNDVSAGTLDPDLLPVVAAAGAGYVAMHMQGDPRTMQDSPHYDDVVVEVGDFLAARLDAARAAGIATAALCADPGIGFGKTLEHNLELLVRLPELVERLDVPVLVGTSRKRFLGTILAGVAGEVGEPPAERRDDATLASVVWALDRGASIVRVHDVRPAARAVALLAAMKAAA
jgi:dihydropteroate synthase